MASNFSFKMFKIFRSLSKPSNRLLLPSVCVACGSAAVYFSSVHVKQQSLIPYFSQPRVAYAASTGKAIDAAKVSGYFPILKEYLFISKKKLILSYCYL